MKQIKISKPYLNPMKKFNIENKCKDETEIQQLRNEKYNIKEHEYQIKVNRILFRENIIRGITSKYN